MNIAKFLAIVLAAVIFNASSSVSADNKASKDLVGKALRGDGSAGYDLWYRHSVDGEDPREGFFWLRLGAENGYCPAIIEMAYELTFIYPEFREAEQWLSKYENNGCDVSYSKYLRRNKLFVIWSNKEKLRNQKRNSRSWLYAGSAVE